MESFKDKLNDIEERNGWNMKFLSNKLKVPYSTWVNWNLGLTEPPIYTKELIMEKLERIAKGEM